VLELIEKQVREAAGEEKRSFVFRSAAELCFQPRPRTWLIRSVLDDEKLAMIFGEATAMKSFVAMDMGLCIATGRTWHGHNGGRRGSVFYVCGEGFSGLNARVKAWAQHHEADLTDIPFFVSERPAQFLDPDGTAEVHWAVDELSTRHGQPALIIVDTLNRNFGPGDENSTQDMTKFVTAMDQLRIRYKCTILIIHHSGWSMAERARGASALRAALDWEYRMTKEPDGIRTLQCTKAKDAPEPSAISFKPEVITIEGWHDDEGEPITSCVMVMLDQAVDPSKRSVLKGARRVAFDALAESDGGSIHIDTWREAAYRAGISPSSKIEAKKKAFQRAVTDLLDAGLIRTTNDYYWRTPAGQNGTKRDKV